MTGCGILEDDHQEETVVTSEATTRVVIVTELEEDTQIRLGLVSQFLRLTRRRQTHRESALNSQEPS